MPTIDVAGEKIHAAFFDAKSDRNLVLVHGSGGDATCWPLAELETLGVNVWSVDLPGHGQSGGKAREDVGEYAAVVEGLVKALGLSRVYLGGHSLGSAVALTLGLAAPAWLSGLVLVGAGARLRVNPAIFEALANDFSGALTLMDSVIFGPAAPQNVREAMRLRMAKTDVSVMVSDFTACDRFDVMKDIRRITLPALVVSGSADVLTSLKYGRFLADNIPDAELVVLEGAGHMMALEQPGAFAGALARFLG